MLGAVLFCFLWLTICFCTHASLLAAMRQPALFTVLLSALHRPMGSNLKSLTITPSWPPATAVLSLAVTLLCPCILALATALHDAVCLSSRLVLRQAFADDFNKRLKGNSWRITNSSDIVPR